MDCAAVVVGIWLRDFENDPFAIGVRPVGLLPIDGEAGQHGAAGVGCGVVDVEVTVFGKSWIKSQAEQAFLVAPIVDPVPYIQEHLGA